MKEEGNTYKVPELEKRNFNIKRFLLKYVKYWYVFAICVAVAFGIARYYNWYATPLYRSSCRIMIKGENEGSATENILKDLNGMKQEANLENEIQILKSKALVSKAVKKLNLNIAYELNGKIKSTELYSKSPVLLMADTLYEPAYFFPIKVEVLNSREYKIAAEDKKHNEVLPAQTYRFNQIVKNNFGIFRMEKTKSFADADFDNPSYEKKNFTIRCQPIENISEYYANSLVIENVAAGSSILELRISEAVPEACADFLNTLSQVYIENSIEQKNLLGGNSLKFIDSQIKQVSEELKSIEAMLLDVKEKKGILDIDEESKLFLGQVKNYDEKISELDAQLRFLDYLQEYIQSDKKINDITPASIGINDPTLVKLITELGAMENERVIKQQGLKGNNPGLMQIDAQIKKSKEAILQSLSNIKQSYGLQKTETSTQLGKIEGKIKDMPKNEIELIGIKRQFTVKEGLYLYLLQKRSETAITLASTVSDKWVVDKAEPDYDPIKPVKRKTYSIALVLGLLLPALFISLKDLLDNKITDKEMLEGATRIPLMGIIGMSDESKNLFTEKKPGAVFLESFRAIRTNIKYFADERNTGSKQNVILITSSISTEGKTFCSYNLSGIFALSEKKTILVCMDLRKPKIPEGLKLDDSKGVSNYLAGTASLEEIIQPSGVFPDLDIILSGQIPPNPSELLMKEKTDKLFETLREKYDYVIIDTPPIGLVTDGIVLTKYSDINIYVVRQGVTRKPHLAFINKLYDDGKIKNLGIVFNAVKITKNEYGYGYGYGYGAEQEAEPNSLKNILNKFSNKDK